jgi:hypothetical protein
MTTMTTMQMITMTSNATTIFLMEEEFINTQTEVPKPFMRKPKWIRDCVFFMAEKCGSQWFSSSELSSLCEVGKSHV